MAEKQSWVFFSTTATAAATDDSTKQQGQRKASSTDHRVRWRQHPEHGVQKSKSDDDSVRWSARPEYQTKLCLAESSTWRRRESRRCRRWQSPKSAKSHTDYHTSVHHGFSHSKYAVLTGAWLLYPEFLLRSRTPPPGGGPFRGVENYFCAKRVKMR